MPEAIGLGLLGVGTAFGIWSSMQTSPAGLYKFVVLEGNEEVERTAREAMNLGAIAIIAVAGGLLIVFGAEAVPAAVLAMLTGGFLYRYYEGILEDRSPGSMIPMINEFMRNRPRLLNLGLIDGSGSQFR